MISLPMIEPVNPESIRKYELSRKARARAAAKRADADQFDKLIFHRFHVIKARMQANGIPMTCYLGPTMLAFSPLEQWLGTDREASVLRHYGTEIHKPYIAAALANECLMHTSTVEEITKNPPVRLRYVEASAYGSIGECMAATKSKSWGNLVSIDPIDADVPLDRHVLYSFHKESRYNRRVEQRKYLKRKLGRKHRKLVGQAMGESQKLFLKTAPAGSEDAVKARLNLTMVEFWRAVKGKATIERAPELMQLSLFEEQA